MWIHPMHRHFPSSLLYRVHIRWHFTTKAIVYKCDKFKFKDETNQWALHLYIPVATQILPYIFWAKDIVLRFCSSGMTLHHWTSSSLCFKRMCAFKMSGSTKPSSIAPHKTRIISHIAVKASKLRCNVLSDAVLCFSIYGSINTCTHTHLSYMLYRKPSKPHAQESDNLHALYKKKLCLILLNRTSRFATSSPSIYIMDHNDQCTEPLNYFLCSQKMTTDFCKICKHTFLNCQSF